MKTHLTTALEIKSLSDREFEGHGSIFGNEDLGGDIVLPGAFQKTLKQHRASGSLPQMFWMHDPSRVAGKWTEMSEDGDGLRVKGVLAPTPLGDEIRTLLKMDAVKGLSIGYRTVQDDFDKEGRRLLKEVELWEVSVVSLPMNPLAQVEHAKSQLSAAGEYVPTPKEFERILREAGCSRKVARDIIHVLPVNQREADDEPREAKEDVDDEREIVTNMEDISLLTAADELAQIFTAETMRSSFDLRVSNRISSLKKELEAAEKERLEKAL